ncbi:hypothetical protein JCM10207_001462 [Rhodosporidiobolus poonsookiae]
MSTSSTSSNDDSLDLSWASAYDWSFLPTLEQLSPPSLRASSPSSPPSPAQPRISISLRPQTAAKDEETTEELPRAVKRRRAAWDDDDELDESDGIDEPEKTSTSTTKPASLSAFFPTATPPPLSQSSLSPPPRTASPPRAPTPADDPFTQEQLFPSLRGLKLESYGPYLTDERIELAWSVEYWNAILRFCRATAPPELWSTRKKQISFRREADKYDIVRTLTSTQPDTAAIRATVGPLGTSTAAEALRRQDRSVHFKFLRGNATTLRFSDLVQAAIHELSAYLSSPSSSRLAPTLNRARTLLAWLRKDSSRWHLFFGTPDRQVRHAQGREVEMGEWWLSDPAPGESRTLMELDLWERETLRREAWRR